MNNNKEIIELKNKRNHLIKETIKYFTKFILTYIKCILLLILNIINFIIPLLILLLVPITLERKLIIAIPFVITYKVIEKKINKYVENKIKYNSQIYENLMDIGYNLGETYKNIKTFKRNNTYHNETTISVIPEKTSETKQENQKQKYSYKFSPTLKSNHDYTENKSLNNDSKTLSRKPNEKSNTHKVNN